MSTALPCPPTTPGSLYDPERELMTLTEQTFRIVSVTLALVESRRPVDVHGLQQQVGLLCAKALDLPPKKAGFARLDLERLAAKLDRLHLAMRQIAA